VPNSKILYIAAHSRSGSTILDRVLSQVEGAFTVGEIKNIWLRSFQENQLCGCGSKFNECDVWKRIVDNTDITESVSVNMHNLSREVDRYKKIPQILHPSLRGKALNNKVISYQNGLEELYKAIFKAENPEFIIDSSKSPNYAMHLMSLKDFNVHVVHLVRDSRAVANSRLRKKKRPEIHWKDEYMAVTPAYKTAFQWNMMNIAMDSLAKRGNYTLVRYEDFMTNPVEVVNQVLVDMSVNDKDLSFINNKKITLDVDHTVSGNPMRFKVGEIELRVDDKWKEELSTKNKNIVSVLTRKRLKKYGYL
jgi:hypothetical protein